MKKYSAVIFDLDGTLLNTLTDLTNAVNHAMSALGFEEKTLDQVKSFVGNGIAVLMELCVPDGKKNPRFEQALEEFKAYYAEHSRDNTAPYDGIMELIKKLSAKGVKMAIVSNKIDFAVKDLNREYWNGIIDVAIGETPQIRRKPAPDTVLKALSELGADKNDAVYVGDSEVDIATAENAGMECISVTWGFRDRKSLIKNGAKIIIDAPDEILKFV